MFSHHRNVGQRDKEIKFSPIQLPKFDGKRDSTVDFMEFKDLFDRATSGYSDEARSSC